MIDINHACQGCGHQDSFLDHDHQIYHCGSCDPDELAWILAHIDSNEEWRVLLESL